MLCVTSNNENATHYKLRNTRSKVQNIEHKVQVIQLKYGTQYIISNDPNEQNSVVRRNVGAAIQDQLCCVMERSRIVRTGFERGGHAYERIV